MYFYEITWNRSVYTLLAFWAYNSHMFSILQKRILFYLIACVVALLPVASPLRACRTFCASNLSAGGTDAGPSANVAAAADSGGHVRLWCVVCDGGWILVVGWGWEAVGLGWLVGLVVAFLSCSCVLGKQLCSCFVVAFSRGSRDKLQEVKNFHNAWRVLLVCSVFSKRQAIAAGTECARKLQCGLGALGTPRETQGIHQGPRGSGFQGRFVTPRSPWGTEPNSSLRHGIQGSPWALYDPGSNGVPWTPHPLGIVLTLFWRQLGTINEHLQAMVV